ncbi:MAG: SRPBCC domain-containing protein [Saprospiraceae bacterium]|nr:SRPBCC domain-containing protein [Saprospiraceae bacterium]
MSKELIVSNEILIPAPAAKVWDALVNPEQTKKYMFGCAAVSDWQVGSPLLWQAEYEGRQMVFVKGHIVAIEPEKLLVYTTFDPNSNLEDIPENYATVTYRLTEQDGQTHLFVSQGDFALLGDGERRYNEVMAGGGWEPILINVANLI